MTTATIAAVGVHARCSVRRRSAFAPRVSVTPGATSIGGVELSTQSHRHNHHGGVRPSSTSCSFNNININSYERRIPGCYHPGLHASSSRFHFDKRHLTASTRPSASEEHTPSSQRMNKFGDEEAPSTSETTQTANNDQTASNSESSAAPIKISMDELLALASCQPTALSLEDMYKYAPKRRPPGNGSQNSNNFVDIDRLRNAQFLHKELPVRIAQRAIDLLTLPHGLNRTHEVQSIANTYLRYLQQLKDFPVPTNAETEAQFTDILKGIVLDRHSIPMAIARGLQSLKDNRKAPVDARRVAEMEEGLNRFFTARVGLRFLVEHHVLSGNDQNSDALYRKQLEAEGGLELLDDVQYRAPELDDCCGAIQKNCDPVKEVRRTVARVTKLCRESYGIAPEIEIVDCTPDRDAELPFTYVPHHLRYMLAELLKNSCRAAVRNYLSGANSQKEDHIKDAHESIHDAPSLPPVKIVVTKGAEDVTIKIADRGGGMPRSVTKRIWTFAHSTMSKEGRKTEENYDFGRDEFTGGHIRGFGLPLARIYARYFGGEVTIKSMEGYGVDAYLYLPVLGVACENLPQRVIRSPGNLDSSHATKAAEDAILDGDGYYDPVEADNDGQARNEDFFEDSNVRKFDSTSLNQNKSKSSSALNTLDERAL